MVARRPAFPPDPDADMGRLVDEVRGILADAGQPTAGASHDDEVLQRMIAAVRAAAPLTPQAASQPAARARVVRPARRLRRKTGPYELGDAADCDQAAFSDGDIPN